ncbi:MAG: flagellar hook-associated protein FlgK [Pseudomonadota bacterium]
MSSINSLLFVGSNAIQAQGAGVASAGKNIANANTEGYQRELIDLSPLQGPPLLGGVRVIGPYRVDTQFLSRREQEANGGYGAALSQSSALAEAETAVGGVGGSELVDAVAAMWAGFIGVSAAPLDEAARASAVNDASELARVFQRLSRELGETRASCDQRITDMAATATKLAAEIADVNAAVIANKDPALLDKRDLAASKLSELLGGTAIVDANGQMSFAIAGGTLVVDGIHSYSVQAVPGLGPDGYSAVRVVDGVHVDDVTGRLTGGKIAGELAVRDGVAATAMADLDNLAGALAIRVNAQHAAGIGLVDATSRDLFVSASGGPITAANITVDAAIVADARHLAAAAVGSGPNSSNNDNALLLAGIRSEALPVIGRTAVDESIRIIGVVGQAKANADRDVTVGETRVDSLAALRDSLSGVSVEEELIRLAAFRNASDAAANFVATVNSMLQQLLEKL